MAIAPKLFFMLIYTTPLHKLMNESPNVPAASGKIVDRSGGPTGEREWPSRTCLPDDVPLSPAFRHRILTYERKLICHNAYWSWYVRLADATRHEQTQHLSRRFTREFHQVEASQQCDTNNEG
jgi:hypothetical protein